MSFHLMPEDLAPTRRGFLAACALAGFSTTVRADGEGGYFAPLSDTHVAEDPKTVARKQTMAANLEKVVAGVLAQPTPPKGVFIDGDLALKDGQSGDYRTLLGLLDPLRKAKLPIHLALGNHDDRDKFRDVVKGTLPVETRVEEKQVGVVKALGLRVVVLDSLDKPNSTPGRLGKTQTDWLFKELDADATTPTLLFVHHNIKAAAASAIVDDKDLLEATRTRKQVKAVVFGHTHVWDVRKDEDGVYRINLPAIGYPFADSQPIGWTRLAPKSGGATLKLFAVGGNKAKDGEEVELTWR